MEDLGLTLSELIFYSCLLLIFIMMPLFYIKSKKPLRSALTGAFSGLAGLFAAHFFGHYIGLYISLNLFTAVVSFVLGIPAVIAMGVIG
ncbi:MAG: pro-sigmaK processing inhibitor BofA family protein [Oscillospiraceae bacterium]|nr:pro-sigmaK processing inhibitor BofA family protein [Oscillospiraceae bacterium]